MNHQSEHNNQSNQHDQSIGDDLVLEVEDVVLEEEGQESKIKKLRQQLKETQEQSREYLTGWQKERADFANYKSEEEKRRKERLENMKTHLVTDFFPVLDSFDMAFANTEAWEAVDANWRTGVEYIYTQFMNTLDGYGISVIDRDDVAFNPGIHDPVETVTVSSPDNDGKVVRILQKGYQSKDMVLRPAKVQVGAYQTV